MDGYVERTVWCRKGDGDGGVSLSFPLDIRVGDEGFCIIFPDDMDGAERASMAWLTVYAKLGEEEGP